MKWYKIKNTVSNRHFCNMHEKKTQIVVDRFGNFLNVEQELYCPHCYRPNVKGFLLK